ncbi:hypothetical protein ACFS5N_00395 [Mucilaginibacter ximonensis]|uniref:Carboxypeptidase-like protein n=1 Tax=Mucilaginibacter ximonensis TaxID=538021 RepID=A0ABW5Y7Q6_9SPHI
MKRNLVFIGLLLMTAGAVKAQTIKGSIYEEGSNQKLTNVFIKDINNKQITLADKDGRFEIKSAQGHTLVFDSPGYVSDTLFLVNEKPLKIEMKQLGVALREVTISTTRKAAFNPQAEYPEVYKNAKINILSPSTIFSKESRNARRLRRFFSNEQRENYVDRVFTASYVSSLVPLKGEELQNFMALYRPSYAYVKSNTGPSLAVYINDSYQKYKALPPDQRKLPNLNGQ